MPQKKKSAGSRVVYVPATTTTTAPSSAKKVSGNASDVVKVQLPFYYNLLFIVVWVFIVYAISQYLTALYFFRPYVKWWYDNGGKAYNRVFSIRQFAEFDYFRLGAWFNALFISEYAKIQSEGAGYFITSLIVGFARINDQDNIGFLLPKHFCQSIVVGDRKDRPNPPEWEGQVDPETNYPITESAWRALLIQWGAPARRTDVPDSVKWRNQPDNFLWQYYQIDVTSEFILSFVTNSISQQGDKWFPFAFLIAVGINRTTGSTMGIDGGWWGFVRFGFQSEKDLTLSTIYNCLYGTAPYVPARARSCRGQWGSIVGSSLLSGAASTVGLLAFLIGTGPVGIALGVASGTITAGASFYNAYRNCA